MQNKKSMQSDIYLNNFSFFSFFRNLLHLHPKKKTNFKLCLLTFICKTITYVAKQILAPVAQLPPALKCICYVFALINVSEQFLQTLLTT